jgi:hypothetical protein
VVEPAHPHPGALELVDKGVLVGQQVGHVDGERPAVEASSRQGHQALGAATPESLDHPEDPRGRDGLLALGP